VEKSEKEAGGQESGKRDSFRDWEIKLEDRLAAHLDSLPKTSQSLSYVTQDSVTLARHFRLTDEVSRSIRINNCKEMDRIRKILKRRCRNCDHVVSSDAEKSFEVPFLGAVCSVCHDLYTALTFNVEMRNMNYFKQIQEAEDKKKNDDGSRGGWRDRAGM
jgi:hypothetical protein